MNYKLIAAVCRGGGIGKNNALPWKIKEDMAHFSKLTIGNGNNAVVMGRKTWESLPKGALAGRDNIVLSSTLSMNKKLVGGHIARTFPNREEAHKFFLAKEYDQVWVVGGAAIYKDFIDSGMVDICSVTFIDAEFPCDTFFPPFDKSWKMSGTYPMQTTQDFPVELRKLVKR